MTHSTNASHLIVPPTGALGDNWPSEANLPQGIHGSISMADWTAGNEGYAQQTFLGASIRNFSMKGGFGDTSSDLNVSLVPDEYNVSDTLGFGVGDDVYHNGKYDKFIPPPVGTPVFFKFGKNHATVPQAWIRTMDMLHYGRPVSCSGNSPVAIDTYGAIRDVPSGVSHESLLETMPPGDKDDLTTTNRWQQHVNVHGPAGLNNPCRGHDHLSFGGILQSYVQNRGPSANPEYSVVVKDPREILSNVVLILNNYAGTTYNNKNMYNIYGFLQHDPSDGLLDDLHKNYSGQDILSRNVNHVTGDITYSGIDVWVNPAQQPTGQGIGFPDTFPITGEGFARRSEAGIPWYRVKSGFNELFQLEALRRLEELGAPTTTTLNFPSEFIDAGYGGFVDFRGFKYVVDFGGIPTDKLPDTYYLDFDQIDLLSLAQELCDVISHDFFVQLLPVIDHPLTQYWFNYNQAVIGLGDPNAYRNLVVGVIRVDAVDRSKQPTYGSVKKYIDNLPQSMNVTNEDIGFELSNVVTDRFVVGAQESELFFFNTQRDRDILEVRKRKEGIEEKVDYLREHQWYHETALNQQVLPFYGFLGKEAVTIPRGWGAYQQIQLDTTGLNAHGVGNYYIATELELRSAMVSYERWKQFLVQYNDCYLESTEEDDAVALNFLEELTLPEGSAREVLKPSEHYGVTVPRCVFDSDKPEVDDEGLPKSPCSPPYGYPLYYKRAERIGIPEAGVVQIQAALNKLLTNYTGMNEPSAKEAYRKDTEKDIEAMISIEIARIMETANGLTWEQKEELKAKVIEMRERQKKLEGEFDNKLNQVQEYVNGNEELLKTIHRLGKQSIENSYKVYNFLKEVADQNLGKKFLVKIPKYVNLDYKDKVSFRQHSDSAAAGGASDPGMDQRVGEIDEGPFGFDYRPINSGLSYKYSSASRSYVESAKRILAGVREFWPHTHYLTDIYTTSGEAGWPGADKLNNDAKIWKLGLIHTGALKTNYNPMSTDWEFNYEPDPKGAFLPSGQYLNLITPKDYKTMHISTSGLPMAVQQKLFPTDPTNFVSEGGRMQAYVRYDNSQFLAFKGLGRDKFVQETVSQMDLFGHKLPFAKFVPDLTEELDNTKDDEFHAFLPEEGTDPNQEEKTKSVAFVTCTLDDKFYMPPKVEIKTLKVYGRTVIDSGTMVQPRIVWDDKDCIFKESYGYYFPHFIPDKNGGLDFADQAGLKEVKIWDYPRENQTPSGTLPTGGHHAVAASSVWHRLQSSGIIPTDTEELDSGNVYALITIPGKIKPTKDSRFQDGPFQFFQGSLIKHFLRMDTVDENVKGFDKPGITKKTSWKPAPTLVPDLEELCGKASLDQVYNAFGPYNAALSALSLGMPEKMTHVANPSPVYPNIVALPLMSNERCYGPWISSELAPGAAKYKEIGGKVEFLKEESLAPWNYGGYTLMDEAGALQAKFANSLLLFSERGGFTFPDTPSGVSLCQALIDGGPLVTNISVNVSESEIRTTYQMDLYTSRFGKMDKQKEIALGKVVRERQKLKDEKNALIRKGLGKSQSKRNFSREYDKFDDLISMSNSTDEFSPLERNHTTQTHFVIATDKHVTKGHDAEGEGHDRVSRTFEGGFMTGDQLAQARANMPTQQAARKAEDKAVAVPVTSLYAGVSRMKSPYWPSPHQAAEFIEEHRDKYYNINDTGIQNV